MIRRKFGMSLWIFILIAFLLPVWAFGQAVEIRTSRGLPQARPDTNNQSVRGGRFGEIYTIPLAGKRHALADEGSYYVTTNLIGTAITASTNITAYADTAGAVGNYFYWRNTESVTAVAPKNIYMDYLKLMVAVVPGSATSWQWALVLDNNSARYTSGGTNFVPVSPNGNINTPSIVSFYAGALTTAVGTSKRTVGRGIFRGVVPTVFDTYEIIFGGAGGGGSYASAAASGRIVNTAAPVVIAPGWNLCLLMYGAAAAVAPTFEFEIGHWEK